MKKIIIYATILIIIVFLFFNCNSAKSEEFSIGLVTDMSGIDDKSFNQSAWEGIQRFAKEYKLSQSHYTFLQSNTEATYIPNLSTLGDDNFSLIIASGFFFVDSITKVSKNFPKTKFLIIDAVVSDRPNVVSAVFNEQQGSFLAGIVAGLTAQKENSSIIGFLGGMEFDVIHRFEAGFEAGVKAVNSDITLLIEYAGDFMAPQTGQTLATKMYDEGARILFHAAGATGNGAIKEAKDRALSGDTVWIIGVDKDQYEDGIYENGKSVILTSMIKRVDVASHSISKMAIEGNFPGGEILSFDLKDNGVGLPQKNPNVSADIMDAVEKYKQDIIAGTIHVPKKPSRLQ